MKAALLNIEIRQEQDVVLSRQRARQIAVFLGFDRQDQVRIATAVSEIARNVFQYASRGKVEFMVTEAPLQLKIIISDHGPGIPNLKEINDGRYRSETGMGLGILGARKLMNEFEIQSTPGQGTVVSMSKAVPASKLISPATNLTAKIADQILKLSAQNPYEELQIQNQELLGAMAELERRQDELTHLNRELEDTNRGVVALYAELDEKADHLRRASEIKSRFLSNMTHEFRTPLNSILSLSRILLDRIDGPLTEEQQKQINFIRSSANDLSELVNDLLDLAKVEAGKVVIRPVEFEVDALFGALRGMLRPLLAHNSSVTLDFDDPTGIPTLHTDESKVSQILRNFISNSIKFTKQGEIKVRASLEQNDQITIAVTDTGIGIASADLTYIFEEFTQVEGDHQTKIKGTGLGLPLSKKLAELLGGRINVRSKPGQGSTFSVTFPIRYQGAPEVTYLPEIINDIDPTRLPVLVVDDNTETLFIYEKYLKGTGFQTIPVRTINEARAALKRFHPVAMILDVLLSHDSTWNFLSETKKSAEYSEMPVFVVTMVDNKQRALSLGAADFSLKPIDREWLLKRLTKVAKQRQHDEVLIIDDDEASRYVLAGLLSDTRFRVVEASGGYSGLQMAAEKLPKVIFLDLAMPDLSGFAVLDRLKTDPLTARIPVIISTSKVLSRAETEALSKKTVAILSKDHSSREDSLRNLRAALALAEETRKV